MMSKVDKAVAALAGVQAEKKEVLARLTELERQEAAAKQSLQDARDALREDTLSPEQLAEIARLREYVAADKPVPNTPDRGRYNAALNQKRLFRGAFRQGLTGVGCGGDQVLSQLDLDAAIAKVKSGNYVPLAKKLEAAGVALARAEREEER